MKSSREDFIERLNGERSEPYNPLLGGRDEPDAKANDVSDAKRLDSVEGTETMYLEN